MDANNLAPTAAAGTVAAGGTIAAARADAADALARRDRFRIGEALPWVIGLAAYLVFPNQMVLGGQTLIMILFALSLDLILGYAGIVTLGHAAYFGVGAYAAALLVDRPQLDRTDLRARLRRHCRRDRRLRLRLAAVALPRAGAAGAHAVDDDHAAAARQSVPRFHRRL